MRLLLIHMRLLLVYLVGKMTYLLVHVAKLLLEVFVLSSDSVMEGRDESVLLLVGIFSQLELAL